MSKLEIMEAVKSLSNDDRVFLVAYLKHLSRVDTPAYKQKLRELNDEVTQGKSFSLAQVERLHANLEKEGL
jgi:hypothetical protein